MQTHEETHRQDTQTNRQEDTIASAYRQHEALRVGGVLGDVPPVVGFEHHDVPALRGSRGQHVEGVHPEADWEGRTEEGC